MIVFYHQIKILIDFWCRRKLNFKSLIQPSETLPVELTIIHYKADVLNLINLAKGASDFLFLKIIVNAKKKKYLLFICWKYIIPIYISFSFMSFEAIFF